MSASLTADDLAAVKTRQRATWASRWRMRRRCIGLANWTPDGFVADMFRMR